MNVINATDCSLYPRNLGKRGLAGCIMPSRVCLDLSKINPFQIKRSKLSASPVVMIDMPVFASFIEREWNTIVRS